MLLQIQSSDVIRLIEQFLREQNLQKSLKTLQEESGVDFNAVNDAEKLKNNIKTGKWVTVLETLKNVKLGDEKLLELYEQILIELAEKGDIEASLNILKRSKALELLKKNHLQRILKLQKALTKYPFDTQDYYSTVAEKHNRRKRISEMVSEGVYTVESSRLLSLLNQSLKWQQHIGVLPKGSKIDLLRNTAATFKSQRDEPVKELKNVVRFGEKGETHAEAVAFSPDGQLLATGTVDGFIEVWDYETGKLRLDVKYQAEEEFMIHTAAILSLSFSRDSEKLAMGSKDGSIKVFTVSDGEVVTHFEKVHESGVTSASFSDDSTRLISSSLDFTAKIHGVNSSKTLCVLKGHKSFVNKAQFITKEEAITASADGKIKLWDATNGECLSTIPIDGKISEGVSVTCLIPFPNKKGLFFASLRANHIALIKRDGTTLRTFSAPEVDDGEEITFSSIATSPKGKCLYGLDEKGGLYCFNTENGELLNKIRTNDNDKSAVALAHHPHLNILAICGLDATMQLWTS